MSVRRSMTEAAIVKAFRDAPDSFVSGESLASIIGVSRAAIWKHIKTLCEKGFEIEASPRLGYRLLSMPDRLTSDTINPLLTTKTFGKNIFHFDSLGSTNAKAKTLASEGVDEGAIVVAEEQFGGKGRLDREWISPKGGIWLSVVLRPQILPINAPRLTIMSAVAVAKAIESLKIRPQIKWPNDILIDGKKVCGILLELAAQPDRIDYVVVGIGINANIDLAAFPDNNRNTTTSLAAALGERVDRVQFTADLLLSFEKECERINTDDWAGIKTDWLKRCSMTGKQVILSMMSGEVSGKFTGIDDNGALMLESPQEQTLGQIKSYSAGDVTVKKQL